MIITLLRTFSHKSRVRAPFQQCQNLQFDAVFACGIFVDLFLGRHLGNRDVVIQPHRTLIVDMTMIKIMTESECKMFFIMAILMKTNRSLNPMYKKITSSFCEVTSDGT